MTGQQRAQWVSRQWRPLLVLGQWALQCLWIASMNVPEPVATPLPVHASVPCYVHECVHMYLGCVDLHRFKRCPVGLALYKDM